MSCRTNPDIWNIVFIFCQKGNFSFPSACWFHFLWCTFDSLWEDAALFLYLISVDHLFFPLVSFYIRSTGLNLNVGLVWPARGEKFYFFALITLVFFFCFHSDSYWACCIKARDERSYPSRASPIKISFLTPLTSPCGAVMSYNTQDNQNKQPVSGFLLSFFNRPMIASTNINSPSYVHRKPPERIGLILHKPILPFWYIKS